MWRKPSSMSIASTSTTPLLSCLDILRLETGSTLFLRGDMEIGVTHTLSLQNNSDTAESRTVSLVLELWFSSETEETMAVEAVVQLLVGDVVEDGGSSFVEDHPVTGEV